MQSEKDYINYYNGCEYIHDFFEIFFTKIVDAYLVYDALDNIVLLHLIDYFRFLF